MSQVAAEKLAEKTAEAKATEFTRADGDAEECDEDSEGHEYDDDDDEGNGGGAAVTEKAKSGATQKVKKARRPAEGEYFTETTTKDVKHNFFIYYVNT